MSTPLAYLGVILIWSTTPLGIKWSGEGPGFLFGVTGRMVIGLLLCWLLMWFMGLKLAWDRAARLSYLAAGLAIYGAMLCVYWASQYIPSGLISVIFGATPLITAVLAWSWLNENSLSWHKVLGMLLGLAGLSVIFYTGTHLSPEALLGVSAVLVSVILQAVSAVWLKRIGAQISAITMTSGGLLLATPLYLVTWIIFDGALPAQLPAKALASILYLGVFGSVIGFILYFYALQRLDSGKIALITLITPVTALLLGQVFNHEVITTTVWIGTFLIITGLALHQWQALYPHALLARYKQE